MMSVEDGCQLVSDKLMAMSPLAMTIGLYLFLPVFILATLYDCTTLTIAFLRV